MTALGQHLRIRLADDRVIASSPREWRILARVVLEQARQCGLLAFGLADTHLHLVVLCTEAAARQLGRRIEISLSARLSLGVSFAPAHPEPIRDQRHLLNAFRYDLGQGRHHGLDWDPLREASNLPDLLGLRPLGFYTVANVRSHLPRVRRSDLLELLEVPALAPATGSLEEIREATLVAAALPDLAGSTREALRAQRALIEVVCTGPMGHDGKAARCPRDDLSTLLGKGKSTISRSRSQPADGRLVTAVRLVLDLMHRKRSELLEISTGLPRGSP